MDYDDTVEEKENDPFADVLRDAEPLTPNSQRKRHREEERREIDMIRHGDPLGILPRYSHPRPRVADAMEERLEERIAREEDENFGLFGTELARHNQRVRAARIQERKERDDEEKKHNELVSSARHRPFANDWTRPCNKGWCVSVIP